MIHTIYGLFALFLVSAGQYAIAINIDSAKGFGLDTRGGLDGTVLKVTSLASEGPGSLRWAVAQRGARIVVFEVGGIINLKGENITVLNPHLTIAGETAPSPGITLIRGGMRVQTHDVQVRHLMIRPGDNNQAKRSGWETDGISVSGPNAYRVVIDHCSISWAVDENVSASGPRDKGHAATSKQITFSNNIIAEALDYATHIKGKHSKGLLVHDYVQDVAVIGNLFAHNDRRNPYFKGHTNGVVVNNLFYNIGNAVVQLGYVTDEYNKANLSPAKPKVSIVGNILLYGRDSFSDLPLVGYQGDVFLQDNHSVNLDGKPMPLVYGDIRLMKSRGRWPKGLATLNASELKSHVLQTAGARPWDRDRVDLRIIASVIEGVGRIIDSQDDVGGYPNYMPTKRRLDPPDKDVEAWLKKFEKK